MDNFNLTKACQSDPLIKKNFRGCFSADTLPILKKQDTAIINLSLEREIGTHWISVAYVGVKTGNGAKTGNDARPKSGANAQCERIEFFDSFGSSPYDHPILVKSLLKSCPNLYWRKDQIQANWSSSCGIFCCYYIYCVSRDIYLDEMHERFFHHNLPLKKLYINDLFVCNVITTLLSFKHKGTLQLIFDLDYLISAEKKKYS